MKTLLLFLCILASATLNAQTGQTCSDPIPAECGIVYFGSTSGIPNDNPSSGVLTCGGLVGTGGQIWYSYTAISDGEIEFSTVGGATDFDTRIHVYSGECGALECIISNDDAVGLLSTVQFSCAPGTTYLIRIGGFNENEGSFELNMTCDLVMFGCLDINAANYSSLAWVDDGSCCYGLYSKLSITAGVFASEIHWDLLDAAGNLMVSGGVYDVAELCLSDDACGYFLVMTDDFGDGWNGGTYQFTDALGNIQFTGTMVDGSGPDTVLIPIGNGDCPFGCMNPLADNYDPEAGFDNGTCILHGCMDDRAQNYDPDATVNDVTCLYTIYGYAFIDANENGLLNQFENGLSNVPVSLMPDLITTYTNSEGYYEFTDLVDLDHSVIQSLTDPNWPTVTTGSEYNTADDLSPFVFGFANETPFMHVDVTSEMSPLFFCGGNASLWMTIENNGNEVMNSTIEITLDAMLAPSYAFIYTSTMPDFNYTTSTDGNTINFSLENVLPSGAVFFDINFMVLAPEFIGQTATNIIMINSSTESSLTDSQTIESSGVLECSFDPNDMTVSPTGYSDEHYILNDTPLDYQIRFQNTGNAPAHDIVVSNYIAENLDLNSFSLFESSHEAAVTINYQTREIQFVFNEIMLPDSNVDEQASHGFIKYRINPISQLSPGTVIENYASIIFDINEPVLTNTAFNTIAVCEGLGDFVLDFTEACPNSYVLGSALSEQGESYIWTISENQVSAGTNLYTAIAEPGEYAIVLTVANPLCDMSTTQLFTIHEVDAPTFTQNGNLLSASGGTNYQWFLNGAPIENETSSTLMAQSSGTYHVESNNEFGCVGASPDAEVIVISIQEMNANLVSIFPNPSKEVLNLTFNEPGIHFAKLIGVDGKIIRDLGKISNNREIVHCAGIAPGMYVMLVTNEAGKSCATNIVIE